MKLPKLSNIFGKEVKKQEEIDRIIQENIRGKTTEEEMEEEKTEDLSSVDQSSAIRKLNMDVDKLKAEVEALRQMSKLHDERFQRNSEELGDFRRSLIEREKEINALRLKATKASDLVSSVQPERLMSRVEKGNQKIEKLKAMLEANKKLIDYMTDELKRIKTDIAAFRGAESLIKLNEEVKAELQSIKKVKLVVEKHADKVEDIFISLQKRFNEFSRLSNEFESLQKSFTEIMKEANKFRVEFENLAKIDDLNSLRKEFEHRFSSLNALKKELEKKKKELDELRHRTDVSVSAVEDIENVLRTRLVELDDELSKLSRMEQKGYVTRDEFEREMEDLFNNIMGKLAEYKREIDEKLRREG